MFWFWLIHRTRFRYPHLLDYGSHKELYSYRTGELQGRIDEVVDFHRSNGSRYLSVTTHYRSMNIHSREILEALIGSIKKSTHLNDLK